MQAIILAAGKGTRMGELTATCPKPMLPVSGKPLLAWKIEMLPEAIDEVILVVGYLGDCVRGYFGEEWQGRRIRYAEQGALNGTGGALHAVRAMVVGPMLVTMGDDLYLKEDLERLLKEDQAILVRQSEEAALFGIIERHPDGSLKQVVEKPHAFTSGLVSTNGFLLPQTFFDYPLVAISETEYGLPQTVATMTKDAPVQVIEAAAWQPVGKPEDIALAEAFLKRHVAL